MESGKIIAVCVNPNPGLLKFPVEFARIAEHGLEGDYHCKPMRESFSRPGTQKPNNDRHVTIVAQEVVDELNSELNINVPVGGLGENILVRGLGDLSKLDHINQILISVDIFSDYMIKLHVTEQNQPCKNLIPYHSHYVKKIYGRRGILCTVDPNSIGQIIRPGRDIYII